MIAHFSAFAVVVAALIVVFVALSLGRARFVSTINPPDHMTETDRDQTTDLAPGFAHNMKAVSAPARQIHPNVFAPPDMRDAASPQRIAPRPPLALPQVKAKEPFSHMIEARSVVALDGGTLVLGKQTIALAGILPLALGEICQDAHGSKWPCGMAARTALRGYLRNRLVSCQRDPALTETVKAVCSVGGRDIARWMAEHGWARTEPSSPFFVLAKQAQDQGTGLNGLDPRMRMDNSLTKEMENDDSENNSP